MKKLWLIYDAHYDDSYSFETIVFGTEEYVKKQTEEMNRLCYKSNRYLENLEDDLNEYTEELKELHQTRVELASLPSRSEYLEKTYKEILYKIQLREELLKEIKEEYKQFKNGIYAYKLASSMYSVLIEGGNDE